MFYYRKLDRLNTHGYSIPSELIANIEMTTQDLDLGIVKEGWLRKKGSRVNLWTERYFVLRGPSLFYFTKSVDVVRNF